MRLLKLTTIIVQLGKTEADIVMQWGKGNIKS